MTVIQWVCLGLIYFILFLNFYRLIIYKIIGWAKCKVYKDAKKDHSFCVIIAGRKEEKVIGNLIDSIKAQNYNKDLIKIFVIAADEPTANVARSKEGVVAYLQPKDLKKGKGYALQFLFEQIKLNHSDYHPDAFVMFDADNLLHPDCIKEFNKALDAGCEICNGYRASKNFDSNWISAVASLSFLDVARFEHNARENLGLSSYVAGTGFMFKADCLGEGGWNYSLLSEDLEFSLDQMLKGRRVAYNHNAIFYDEQPETIRDYYVQRKRWQKGTYQNMVRYYPKFLKQSFKLKNDNKNKRFTFIDFTIFLTPFLLFTTVLGLFLAIYTIVDSIIQIALNPLLSSYINFLLTFLGAIIGIAGITMLNYILVWIAERKRIKCGFWKMLGFIFMIPLAVFILIPIPIVTIFQKVGWKVIAHNNTKKIDEIDIQINENNSQAVGEKQPHVALSEKAEVGMHSVIKQSGEIEYFSSNENKQSENLFADNEKIIVFENLIDAENHQPIAKEESALKVKS